jgi:23S rRNA pseudouridine1911/1915/1917 synthase
VGESDDSAAATRLRVEPVHAGSRLDAFLAERLGISRNRARQLLADGHVALNGRTLSGRAKGRRLAGSERVEVGPFVPPAALRVAPEPDLPLRVLATGPGWLAVDKPPGVPVHPLRAGEAGTLLGAVSARHPEIHGVGEGGLRSGVVHRLDVGTSGVVLFATSAPRWTALRAEFAAHRVDKRYRALALGRLEGEARVEVGLRVAQHRPARVRVVAPDAGRGRRSALRWRALEQFSVATLVEVSLETGVLHQIRVTLAHLGHPLAGDRDYGPAAADDPTGAPRPMLHAARIGCGSLRAESPDAPDFRALLGRLRDAAPG